MTETIFVSKFLNELFSIKYSLKNSTGKNKINKETNKVINDQNKPWPVHEIKTWFTKPEDSKNK